MRQMCSSWVHDNTVALKDELRSRSTKMTLKDLLQLREADMIVGVRVELRPSQGYDRAKGGSA